MLLNFREISGLTGHGGGRLRPGLLFRGGAVGDPGQALALRERGIRRVYDLRNRTEAARHPSALPGAGLDHPLAHHDIDTGAAVKLLRQAGATPEASHAAMVGLYRQLAVEFRPVLREILTGLAGAEGGVMIHCAVGKDRTGIAVALLLRLLGVAPEPVLQDYLASNAARAGIAASILRRYPGACPENDPALVPLLVADAAYLDAFFRAIGPLEPWLRHGLGLEAETLARLRDRFLH